MTHVTCRLTAKNRDQLRNPTLGNRVWASFFTVPCLCSCYTPLHPPCSVLQLARPLLEQPRAHSEFSESCSCCVIADCLRPLHAPLNHKRASRCCRKCFLNVKNVEKFFFKRYRVASAPLKLRPYGAVQIRLLLLLLLLLLFLPQVVKIPGVKN